MAKKTISWTTAILVAIVLILLVKSTGVKTSVTNVYNNASSGSNGGGGGGGQGGNDNTDTTITPKVTIDINPLSVCVGDTVTGTISSNMYSAQCTIQYRHNQFQLWQTQSTVTLSSSGFYSIATPANVAGTAIFRVVCLKAGNYAASNEVTVTVNNCPQTYDCFDSDGGIDFVNGGNCQDSYHNAGYMDGCVSGETYMREYYCDDQGICQWIPNTKWKCNQMGCEQIVHPSSQASCDLGNCLIGTCTYVPATMFVPAKCEC